MPSPVSSYNKAKHASGNPLMRLALSNFHGQVLRLLPAGVDRVLEVGCGEGYSAEAVLSKRHFPLLAGGDISAPALKEARSRFPAMHYHVLDATHLPFRDKSVDLVMALEVLEHLRNPQNAVSEFRRVSRRYLLLSVPNEPIFRLLRMASGKGLSRLGDHPEHVQHWSLSGFAEFLRQQGLRTLAVTTPIPYSWSVVLCEVF